MFGWGQGPPSASPPREFATASPVHDVAEEINTLCVHQDDVLKELEGLLRFCANDVAVHLHYLLPTAEQMVKCVQVKRIDDGLITTHHDQFFQLEPRRVNRVEIFTATHTFLVVPTLQVVNAHGTLEKIVLT